MSHDPSLPADFDPIAMWVDDLLDCQDDSWELDDESWDYVYWEWEWIFISIVNEKIELSHRYSDDTFRYTQRASVSLDDIRLLKGELEIWPLLEDWITLLSFKKKII